MPSSRAAAITTGTSPTSYSPDRPVTRAEMATFLTRALHLPVPIDETAGNEGDPNVFVFAKKPFNEWTSEGRHWDFMNANYESMVVWEPYWDQRLDDFADAIVYKDSYAIKVDSQSDTRFREHPDWVLRDANGDPTYIPFGCSNGCPQYAADLGNPEFVADWIAGVQDFVDRGYTGLYIDDVNLLWRVGDVNGDSVIPIDPRTGQPMTLNAWRTNMVNFVETVRDTFPDIEIWHNVIWYADSPTFDNAQIRRQIEAADVIHLERGMNDPGLKDGTTKYGMQTFMSFIDRVHGLGGNVALLDTHADTLKEQWFNLAGYFLINDGDDLVSTESWDLVSPDNFFAGFDIDIGHALGDRKIVDGTIQREFTDGLVIMNEPRADPVTVQLDTTWHRQDGTPVTRVTLGTGEAIVLKRP